MGIPTDFFFAPTDALDTATLRHGPKPPFPVFACKNTDPVKLATLHTLLLGESLDDTEAVVDRMPPEAAAGSDDGPWIHALPDELITLLGRLDTPARAALATAWSTTEEWQCPGPDFNAWFLDLARFITQPRPAEDRLWLWFSL